jgi:hypothetical protein
MPECANPRHDHTTPMDEATGMTLPAPVPMFCNDCGLPTHYDMGVETYVHDDPAAPACFLVPTRPEEATPCTDEDACIYCGRQVGQAFEPTATPGRWAVVTRDEDTEDARCPSSPTGTHRPRAAVEEAGA